MKKKLKFSLDKSLNSLDSQGQALTTPSYEDSVAAGHSLPPL